MTSLDALYIEHGQSPWIDNLRRDWLKDGTLQSLIDDGVRGVTSNPSIFAKALATSTQYDADVAASELHGAEAVFEALAVADVRDACDVLAGVHDASRRELAAGTRRYLDGFVSLEVSPRLAYDAAATTAAAKRLAAAVGRPNLMVKIPATVAGLASITSVLSEGINVNVTLIFSLERYAQVMDAYVSGVVGALRAERDVSQLSSVASFFVSRVDTAADPQLEQHPELRGRGANAQVAEAYEMFRQRFDREDARELLSAGAQVQRPLWASTSTKNPSYHDLLYVEPLIADETVNTMPDATLASFIDHGRLDADGISRDEVRHAMRQTLKELSAAIDVHALTDQLERDGVAAFESSYEELLQTVTSKLAP